MERGPFLPARDVEAALSKWRRNALNVFAWAGTITYLPAEVIMVAGQAPPQGWPSHVIITLAYLSFLYCALRHRADYRYRAWVLLSAGYAVAVIHLITIPQGPFGRALPAMLPIMAIVVLGTREAWTATGISIACLIFGPLLQSVPELVEILTLETAKTPLPPDVIMHQSVALIALLAGQMILLDRFHDFLMRSLASLQRESKERAAAYAILECAVQERRRLENELALVGDEERRRLGLDIHDGVCQQLTGALLRCEAMARGVERGKTPRPEDFAALASLLEDAIDESHAVAKGLCPLEPVPAALTSALRMLSKRTRGITGFPCIYAPVGDVNVPDPVTAQHLYRIAQEAVSNAVRHAKASRIDVKLQGDTDWLTLEVADNGKGLPTDAPGEGMGMRTLEYRTHLLEGELSVTTTPGGGTRVSCRVPARVAHLNKSPGRPDEKHHEQ